MTKKVSFRDKKRPNSRFFKQSAGPFLRNDDYGSRQGDERFSAEWLRESPAYQMQLRGQDQNPTNFYGGM